MLDNCAAIYMASDREWITRCRAIGEEAGFGETYPFLGVDDIARRVRKSPVQFLVIHYHLEEEVMRETIRAIRHHHEKDVKFMPIMAFTKDSHASLLKHFLKMGFDDIITFPCSISHLVSRFALQVERKLDYFQAGDYFGPDRRRLLEEDGDESERRAGGAFTHYVIQRDPEHGVKILSQDHHTVRESA